MLDPFAGSGTTLMVAQQLRRQAVGVELLADRVSAMRARIVDPSAVVQGNALDLDELALGKFELCLTSPAYMNAVDHPQDPLTGYKTLNGDYQRYLGQMAEVFASLASHLVPDGTLVLSVANIRTGDTVTSLSDDLVAAAVGPFTVRATIPLVWDQPPVWLIDDRLVVLDPISSMNLPTQPADGR